MTIRVVKLDAELHLMSDFNTFGICVLETSGQGLRHVQIPCEFISLGHFVNDSNAVFV